MYCDTLFVKINSNFVDGSNVSSFLQQVHNLFQKQVLHRVRASASPSNLQQPLFSLRSSSSCLRLLPHLRVNSILPLTLFQ